MPEYVEEPPVLLDLEVISPRGRARTIKVREGTNDAATMHATFWFGQLQDEYGLADRYLEGWALDIGASIGPVALALALDNPDLQVVAVEAVPENADLLGENAVLAGVADRIHVLANAAAGDGDETCVIRYGPYEIPGIPPEHAMEVRFVGNLFRDHGSRGRTVAVPAVSLSAILARFGIDRVRFMKIDCEGCEWAFLASPDIGRVDEIIGEWHDRDGPSSITALLAPTHTVEVLVDDRSTGLFRATRR